MDINKRKKISLILGIALSAMGGGLSAYLFNWKLSSMLVIDGDAELPDYQKPEAVETTTGSEPVAAVAAMRPQSKPSIGRFSSIQLRNIFNSEAVGQPPEAAPVETQEPSEEGEDTGPVSNLAPLCVYVNHTLEAEPQRYSWALVARDERGTDEEIFRIGDEVFEEGSALVSVRRKEIEIRRRDDSVQKFTVGGECESGATAPAPPSEPAAVVEKPAEESKGGLGDGISQLGENRFAIESTEIDKAMSNLEQLARDARVVPHYQNGDVVGFKVFRIKAGSVYSKLGLKNGDIIERVNGQQINSTERALALYQALRSEKEFQLDLSRRNQPLTLSYEVK